MSVTLQVISYNRALRQVNKRECGFARPGLRASCLNQTANPCFSLSARWHARRHGRAPAATGGRACGSAQIQIEALIFDCDGVIVESEDIHRRAYNATFEHFQVHCPGQQGAVEWSEAFYDVRHVRFSCPRQPTPLWCALANPCWSAHMGLSRRCCMVMVSSSGTAPRCDNSFSLLGFLGTPGTPPLVAPAGQHGWPTSSVLGGKAPANEEEQAVVIDTLQDWKTDKYKDIVGSGGVAARPGVVRLMDEARAAGVPVAVCSAATKAAVQFVLEALLGRERFAGLDLFMAGDDVAVKKPDPTIYRVAAERLGVSPSACLVVEDSVIGLQAALGAGMTCIITYTSSTAAQEFQGADAVLSSLEGVSFGELQQGGVAGRDDRASAAAV